MKKAIVILLVSFFSITAKAQHFGVNFSAGSSWVNKLNPQVTGKVNPKLFYGFGVFYTKKSETSSWGFRTGLNFDKRNIGATYSKEYYDEYEMQQYYIDGTSTTSDNLLALSSGPTLNISKKLQLALDIHYTYLLSRTGTGSSDTYLDKEKKILYESNQGSSKANGLSLTDRSSYGANLMLTYQVSGRVDLGLTYCYWRQFKYYVVHFSNYKPFYNALNITTNIYFKSRKNAVEN